jgi:hypothetical protein
LRYVFGADDFQSPQSYGIVLLSFLSVRWCTHYCRSCSWLVTLGALAAGSLGNSLFDSGYFVAAFVSGTIV